MCGNKLNQIPFLKYGEFFPLENNKTNNDQNALHMTYSQFNRDREMRKINI